MASLPSLMALRCFDASARHTSFTRAADEIHITQGAVSHQILGLESQLGVPLFMRKRSGLQLTSAGRAYWGEISPALRQIERATQDLLTNRGHGGALNLSVASSFGTYWLIPRLSGFIAGHPEITLNLATHVGPVDFTSSRHDAAIEFCHGAAAGLRAELVLPLVLSPYAAPQLLLRHCVRRRTGRIGPAELKHLLSKCPLIRHAGVPRAWSCWLASAGLLGHVPRHRLDSGPQFDLLSMALNAAIAGHGIALLPEYAASHALAGKQLERVSEVTWTAEMAYYLRYPEWKADLVAVRRFQDWLKVA